MRRVVRRIVRRFAGWLECRAAYLEGCASALHDWAMEPEDGKREFDELLAATINSHVDALNARYARHNALFSRMLNG